MKMEKGKTQLFIVRHAEREDEVNEDYIGANSLVPITDKGQKQAFKTGEKLKELIKFDNEIILISSPFLRCIETSQEIVKSLKCKIKIDCEISEWIQEKWFKDEPPKFESEYLKQFEKDVEDCSPIDFQFKYETIYDMKKRYESFLKRVIERYNEKTIVVVTHGFGVQVMTQYLDEQAFIVTCPHCSITFFEKQCNQNEWKLLKLAFDEHLNLINF